MMRRWWFFVAPKRYSFRVLALVVPQDLQKYFAVFWFEKR